MADDDDSSSSTIVDAGQSCLHPPINTAKQQQSDQKQESRDEGQHQQHIENSCTACTSIGTEEDMEEPLAAEAETGVDDVGEADDGLAQEHANMCLPASLLGRTPSLLSSFAHSPLKLSSFPPFGHHPKQHPDHRQLQQKHTETPPSKPSSHENTTAILASRLRQERDEAIASLAYCALEHDITVKTLERELQELRSGRDSLKRDLQEMVGKLIEGERAQRQLEQVTDNLCQTESSYQQARGRLETAYAELDDLRARLGEGTSQQMADTPSRIREPCSCRDERDSLRRHTATLEDELDLVRRQHQGSANLVLSLQCELDQKSSELDQKSSDSLAAKRDLEIQSQQLNELQNHLAASEAQRRQVEQALQAERKANQDANRAHLERIDEMQEILEDAQLQRQGAINRALALQEELDARRKDISGLTAQKESALSQLTAAHDELQSQTEQSISASADAQSLQAEVNSLQRSVEHMVLLQLQSKRTISSQASTIRALAAETRDRCINGQPNEADLSSLVLVLIQASLRLQTLKHQYDIARQGNADLAKRQVTIVNENNDLKLRLADHVKQAETIKSLLASNASLQQQLAADQDSAAKDLQVARSLAEAAVHNAQTIEASLKDTSSSLEAARTELQDTYNTIAKLKEELTNAQESLRVAEEEGRNLVADFNMLSEELENRQHEDETRSAHTADTERRLAEATAKEEALRTQCDLDAAALIDLNERLKALEVDLEQMQISVEETDDKYLESLKTIKRQNLQLDKLKIRNEALARANAILSRAMPEAEHDPMAPVHTSARKRSLPQEFVAPDPGPAVVISAPASVRATSQRGAISAHAASKAASHRGEVEVASVDMVDISMRGPSGISLERSRSGDDKTSRDAQPLKQTSFSKVKAGSTISHRTPLAPVTGQRSLHQQAASAAEKGASQIYASASVSLTSKVPFKPSSGLTVKSQSKATPTSDTRSLLAALHALKRPA